jgi:hypothetical protein
LRAPSHSSQIISEWAEEQETVGEFSCKTGDGHVFAITNSFWVLRAGQGQVDCAKQNANPNIIRLN